MKIDYNFYENCLTLFTISFKKQLIHKHIYDKCLFYNCLIKLFIRTRHKFTVTMQKKPFNTLTTELQSLQKHQN